MFIKNIIISGFRSYREQHFPDGFSPQTNVIVGKNGSGKSNFFAAIQFVLSERYTNLSASERKDLFHMGSGKSPLSVFVEIVFDNSDGRLVIPGRSEEKEVRIRRIIGLKQDEFRVNDRKFSAAEVRQLVESAGLSSSNPYNIVEQGKIGSLANMSEHARFELIKEVAGTKIYEERRDESKKILAETGGKLEDVDKSIQKLNDRLKELENDTKELKEFQELDDRKKSVEYFIFKAELDHARKQIREADEEWRSKLELLNKEKDRDGGSESEMMTVSSRITELQTLLQSLEQERSRIERELSVVNNKQVVAELDATHAASKKSSGEEEHNALLKERSQLNKTLNTMKGELAQKKQKLSESEKKAEVMEEKVNSTQRTVETLQERRNRSALFKNKKERDAWIATEKMKKQETIERSLAEIADIKKQVGEVDNELKEVQNSMTSSSKKAEGSEKEALQREKQMRTILKKRDDLNQERRSLWQKIHEQECVVQRTQDAVEIARQQYERAVRHDIRDGLESLGDILRDINDPALSKKVYGPVIDLISVGDEYAAAVDATAGNALFNVVVDSFDTSAFLLEQMNKRRKPGRLTFFPLDICKGFAHSMPSTSEVTPLVTKVGTDRAFLNVISEMFGRTALVSNLEIGARLAKDLGCDIVTLDGDQLSRKGGVSGGYIDRRKLKFVTHVHRKRAAQLRDEERSKFDALCQNVAAVEQEITNALNELQSLKNANMTIESDADAVIRERRVMEERLSRLRTRQQTLEHAKNALNKVIEETQRDIKSLEEESKDSFKSTWSSEDEEKLQQSREVLNELRKQALQAQNCVLQETTTVQLDEDTVEHIQHRISLVEDRIRELERLQKTATALNQERQTVSTEQKELMTRWTAIEQRMDSARKEKDTLESTLQSISTGRISAAKVLEERRNELMRADSKRGLLAQREEEIMQKIRRLGITTPSQSGKYANLSISRLMHALKQINLDLQKFSHVNRRAADQYNTVVQSKNDLETQKNALLDELKSINELLDHLEKEKDTVIERTYKQIQFQFEDVFKELVGRDDCSAELLLVRPRDSSDERDYTGARLRVSFGSSTGVSEIQHLSGGQKSLVALALVFAIQRCDPAPFYLFDEVDAALDGEYRAAVARVIKKQSSESQFIFTTFKTEMLEIADKVLGIFFYNKVTRIQTITKEEGEKLLKQAAIDDRKRSRENDAEDSVAERE